MEYYKCFRIAPRIHLIMVLENFNNGWPWQTFKVMSLQVDIFQQIVNTIMP